MNNGIIGAGSSNGITRIASVGALEVEKVYKSDFQKAGTETAMLRQKVTITSIYPSKKVGNERQDSLSPIGDYGFESNTYHSVENRVGFPNVAAGTTLEQAKALITSNPEACLYKVLSNDVILTSDQHYAITNGFKTKDDFANSQVARYPINDETQANGTAGKLIKDEKGNVVYRAVFFSRTAKADEDYRGTSEVYMSPEIMAELVGTPVSAALVVEQGL